MNGAVFWFAVAIFRLMPAAQSCCSEKLLWAPEDLTKGASFEDPKIPVLEYQAGGEAYGSRRSATFRNRSMQRRLGPLPHPVTGTHAPSSPHIPGLRTCFRDIYIERDRERGRGRDREREGERERQREREREREKKRESNCLLYTSPSPRDLSTSRMPSSA